MCFIVKGASTDQQNSTSMIQACTLFAYSNWEPRMDIEYHWSLELYTYMLVESGHKTTSNIVSVLWCVADPPRITTQPHELKDVAQGKSAKFSIQASGTETLNYNWQWKPAEERGGSKDWQQCDAKLCKGATLSIAKVEKSNEGSYRCVVSNFAGNQTSIPANLTVGKSSTFKALNS